MGFYGRLFEIKQDCIKLKKKNQLHEYGQGQLDLIEILEKEMKKDKYSIEDLKKIPKESRLALIGLMIANELHKIHSILEERK